jgi:hypothetical protein
VALQGKATDHPLVRKIVATVKQGLRARGKAEPGMERVTATAEKAREIKNAHTFVPLPHAVVRGTQTNSESPRLTNSLSRRVAIPFAHGLMQGLNFGKKTLTQISKNQIPRP